MSVFCMLPSAVHSSYFPSLLTPHLKNLRASVGPAGLRAGDVYQMSHSDPREGAAAAAADLKPMEPSSPSPRLIMPCLRGRVPIVMVLLSWERAPCDWRKQVGFIPNGIFRLIIQIQRSSPEFPEFPDCCGAPLFSPKLCLGDFN